MRGRVPENVQRWADYSFLFISALDKLPSIECEVYRGIDLPLTQVSHEYKVGTKVWLPSVTSTTTKQDTALEQFGKSKSGNSYPDNQSGNRYPGTLIKIKAVFAKNIKVFSMFPDESELLLSPNSCLKIDLALSSEDVANLRDFGTLPENVDLIVASQQAVDMDAVIAAINKDEEDLQQFTQSKYLVVPPQAATIPSIFAPLSPGASTVTVVFSCDLEVISKESTGITSNFVLRSDHSFSRYDGGQLKNTVFVEAQTSVEKVGVAELRVFLLLKRQKSKSKDYHFRSASSALRDALFEKIESQINYLRASWLSILQEIQSVLTDEAMSSITYYRNVNFAAAVCVELSVSCDRSGLTAEARDYAAAGKTLHDILTSRPELEQERQNKLESFLSEGKKAIPQIEKAYEAAKSHQDHTKTLDLQVLRCCTIYSIYHCSSSCFAVNQWALLSKMQTISKKRKHHGLLSTSCRSSVFRCSAGQRAIAFSRNGALDIL